MAAVEPQLAARRQAIDQRPARQLLQPRRPVDCGQALCDRRIVGNRQPGRRSMQATAVAGIVDLVRARQGAAAAGRAVRDGRFR